MSITVECDRIDCGASFDVDQETEWALAPGIVAGLGPTIALSLPEGWAVDRAGYDRVIHCAEHAHS